MSLRGGEKRETIPDVKVENRSSDIKKNNLEQRINNRRQRQHYHHYHIIFILFYILIFTSISINFFFFSKESFDWLLFTRRDNLIGRAAAAVNTGVGEGGVSTAAHEKRQLIRKSDACVGGLSRSCDGWPDKFVAIAIIHYQV